MSEEGEKEALEKIIAYHRCREKGRKYFVRPGRSEGEYECEWTRAGTRSEKEPDLLFRFAAGKRNAGPEAKRGGKGQYWR